MGINKDKKLPARDDPKWWDERNARRREQYKKDKLYREQQKASARKTYRAENKVAPSKVAKNLKAIETFGQVRDVQMPEGTVKRHVLTRPEMAQVMDRELKIFYRWLKDGRFPHGALMATDMINLKGNKGQRPVEVNVYLLEEAQAAAQVLARHFASVSVLRVDHTDTLIKLYDAILEVRKAEGLPMQEMPENITPR